MYALYELKLIIYGLLICNEEFQQHLKPNFEN
jgi:hypothetical protein